MNIFNQRYLVTCNYFLERDAQAYLVERDIIKFYQIKKFSCDQIQENPYVFTVTELSIPINRHDTTAHHHSDALPALSGQKGNCFSVRGSYLSPKSSYRLQKSSSLSQKGNYLSRKSSCHCGEVATDCRKVAANRRKVTTNREKAVTFCRKVATDRGKVAAFCRQAGYMSERNGGFVPQAQGKKNAAGADSAEFAPELPRRKIILFV